jgi:transposase InsO family protein
MFAAIRYYRTDPDSIESVVRQVREDFVPIIRETPGFVSYFVLTPRQGEIVSVSVFEEERSAQESNMKAEEWVRQNLSELLPSPDFSAEYLEGFYNTRRRHSALGHLSPSEYEAVRLRGGAVA